jgi:hypothetical protein
MSLLKIIINQFQYLSKGVMIKIYDPFHTQLCLYQVLKKSVQTIIFIKLKEFGDDLVRHWKI